MAAQAMPVLDQEQLLAGQIITGHDLVLAKRMVAWHRYDDWIFCDFHRLDIGKPNFQACLACHTSAYSLPWAKMSQILHATTTWSPGATETRAYGCEKSR